jgi:O-antigen ligase
VSTLSAQRFPVTVLTAVTVLTVATFALVLASQLNPEALLIYWLALGGVVIFVLYVAKGDLLTAVLLWFVTLIALHEEFWRMPVPLFFSLTIPRLGLVVLVLLLGAMALAGRVQLRHAWPVSGLIAALAVYFFLSASISGFETRSVVSVHYRLIGGYIFPFTVFALVLHAFKKEDDFRRLTIFFALLSAYLTFTGWCEQLSFSDLIWPQFINDPTVGIHWGRVRGPFVMSAAMGLALVYCFFNNLVLAKNIQRGRWLLYALNTLMLPVIFWTKTRSVWLSFVLCSMIWAMYSRRRTTRTVAVSLLLALAVLVAAINMDNFLTAQREKGGLTDIEPLLLRIGLAHMTWEMVQEHPLVGVGFGHFRDYAPGFARDPSSPFYAFGSTALEHNNFLSIVAETGLVGVALYLAMVIFLLRYSVRLYRKLPPTGMGFIGRDLLVLYWILTMAYFMDGTFRETSDNPFANSLFFGLSAVPVALDILLGPVPIRVRAGFPPPGRSEVRPNPPVGPRPSSVPPRPAGIMAPGRAPARRIHRNMPRPAGGPDPGENRPPDGDGP